MSSRATQIICRMASILAAATVCFFLTFLTGYNMFAALNNRSEAGTIALAIVLGFFAAGFIREVGKSLLPTDKQPWYRRPRAIPFLVGAVIAMSIVYVLLIEAAVAGQFLHNTMPAPALFLFFTALQLYTIVFTAPPFSDIPDDVDDLDSDLDDDSEFELNDTAPTSGRGPEPRFRRFDPDRD